MNEEFEVIESQSAFDIKAFLFKALSYWKLFVVCLVVGIIIIYQQNIRKQQSYRLGTQISIEDDKNPLFTSNTSLTFNWGGVSGKVSTIKTTLLSRSHHEKVVDNLEFYVKYLKQGRFRKEDIYTYAPFRFSPLQDSVQLINSPIKVSFSDSNTFSLSFEFASNTIVTQNFTTKEKSIQDVEIGNFSKTFSIGESINLPFLNGTISVAENRSVKAGDEFYLELEDFDKVVAQYKGKLQIGNAKNSSILNLAMVDFNKAKIVDYLNETVAVLSEDQLERKNQFVTNTINFIDEQLSKVRADLTLSADSLNSYRQKNRIFNLDEESIAINSKLSSLELEKDEINRKLAYYNSLKNYLETSNKFTDVPAPSIAGIDDANILGNISRINALSVQKSKYEATVRSDATIFKDLNRQIEALKTVLLENISSSTNGLRRELGNVNSKIGAANSKIRKLPKDQQELLTIQRQYALSEQTYNMFLTKRGEADIIKSSTVSDILVIDSAKDTGAKPISLNLNSRYIFALLGGLLPPFLLAFLMTLFDTKIHGPHELQSLSKMPVLGVVGKNNTVNNLAVHLKPKSAIAESFRAIRSSLQYMYKQHNLDGAKTVMITSSISGEGKTFCSINIATVFALSEKRTVLVGLDLRKPKIFGDFEIENNIGVVNYLIGQKNLDEVTQSTAINNLDVITSGPVPPNPSELLIGERMDELISQLKKKYDYIVLDTPPIGLVADAFELLDYADASLYVVRQNYTKKGMLQFINEKSREVNIKNMSFIYNFYNQKGKYGYGYGYGNGYNYGYGAYGYHEEDKAKKGIWNKVVSAIKGLVGK